MPGPALRALEDRVPTQRNGEPKPESRLKVAQAACLCLGVAALVWGLAPAVLQWIAARGATPVGLAQVGPLPLLMGLAFIGLQTLIRRGRRWAIRTAFLLAVLLAAMGLALMTVTGVQAHAVFVILLGIGTAAANWLALAVLGLERSRNTAPRPPRHSAMPVFTPRRPAASGPQPPAQQTPEPRRSAAPKTQVESA